MNINDVTWGLELETTMPASDSTPIGAYHHGLPVAWLPDGWNAERDSSIRPRFAHRKGCEFISPRLRGYEGLAEACEAARRIRDRGGRVNESCGVHVTIQFDGDAATLARLISLVANHEKGIYATTGTHRREQNVYSKKIKQYGNRDDARRYCESDRYHLLNLTHLARGRERI